MHKPEHTRDQRGGIGGKCKRILSRSMKHAVRYSNICVYMYEHTHTHTHSHTHISSGYRARYNGIPRYINFGAHFSHHSSISLLARATGSSPFSRLLSLKVRVPPYARRFIRPPFSSSFFSFPFPPSRSPFVCATLLSPTRNRGTIPQTFAEKTKFHR